MGWISRGIKVLSKGKSFLWSTEKQCRITSSYSSRVISWCSSIDYKWKIQPSHQYYSLAWYQSFKSSNEPLSLFTSKPLKSWQKTAKSIQTPKVLTIPPTTPSLTNLISIKCQAHLPLKLTPSNYPSWRAQFNSPLFGRDLQDFVNDTFICPEPTILLNGASTPYIARVLWLRQDQLILHVVLASLSETVISKLICSTTLPLLLQCHSKMFNYQITMISQMPLNIEVWLEVYNILLSLDLILHML